MRLSEELQAAIHDAGAVVRIGYPWWLSPFLMRGVVAITLGRRIYVEGGAAVHEIDRILRHELVHVAQVNRLGLIRFLCRYISEFIRHWRATRSASQAYMMVSFEIEAYAEEKGVQSDEPEDSLSRRL